MAWPSVPLLTCLVKPKTTNVEGRRRSELGSKANACCLGKNRAAAAPPERQLRGPVGGCGDLMAATEGEQRTVRSPGRTEARCAADAEVPCRGDAGTACGVAPRRAVDHWGPCRPCSRRVVERLTCGVATRSTWSGREAPRWARGLRRRRRPGPSRAISARRDRSGSTRREAVFPQRNLG